MSYIVNNGRKAVPETLSIYQIYVRNFTPEGTFSGAASHLARIRTKGFEWIYQTPVNPVGTRGRKGAYGSPYAIADYRAVNPELGTIEDFRSFVRAAHDADLKVMLDIVFNHTSPDSVLAKEHPEWFLHDRTGALSRKCSDWSDVVDFDFSHEGLWDELTDILSLWRSEGVDGFRCDVASLVPADFWTAARKAVDPDMRMVWLAESVHPSFLADIRARGYGGWSEGELHRAFDLTYDYDGWEKLDECWSGAAGLGAYVSCVVSQQAGYPEYARKIRFLENHDQPRAASRFAPGGRLENWTAFYQLLPGCTFAYMGQEYGIPHLPDLFEKDPVRWDGGNAGFYDAFTNIFTAAQTVKAEAPFCDIELLAGGVAVISRRERYDTRSPGKTYTAVFNLDQRSGSVAVSRKYSGTDLLTGSQVSFEGRMPLCPAPLILEG